MSIAGDQHARGFGHLFVVEEGERGRVSQITVGHYYPAKPGVTEEPEGFGHHGVEATPPPDHLCSVVQGKMSDVGVIANHPG